MNTTHVDWLLLVALGIAAVPLLYVAAPGVWLLLTCLGILK